MTELAKGNLLDAKTEALVNTVNCVGVMGKGIALQFRQAFPDNFKAYEAACRRGEVVLGSMFVFPRDAFENPRFIINFPTKEHWRGKSRIQDIESGLRALTAIVKSKKISSIAVPPLGCGNGGLEWHEVRPRIEKAFAALPNVTVFLYEPEGAPSSDAMTVRTTPPRMTSARAAILGLMSAYAIPGYRLSLLEIQKLAYFLQCAGEPLRLQFEKGKYGPYAETLHHVLQRLEGHFIRGYGDRSRDISVALVSDAVSEAETFLAGQPDTQERFARVARLIEGFETPYGMELLATVHWIATREDPAAAAYPEKAVQGVHQWSSHKRATFHPKHVHTAWSRLRDQGWLHSPS